MAQIKRILKCRGLWYAAASVVLLYFLYLKTYDDLIVRIPSPEFDNVRRFYWWMMVAGCGFLLFEGVCLWTGKKKLWLFPLTAVFLVLFYMAVLPPFSAPDEQRHFVTAYRISSEMMGQKSVADEAFLSEATAKEKEIVENGGTVLVRAGDARQEPYSQVGRDSYALMLDEIFSRDPGGKVTVRPEQPVGVTPVVYLPQALGITFARILGLGYIPLIFMGRLFNLLAFAGIVTLAVKVMPFRREILMAVSCLPMTLHLAASLSYDTMLIALTMLFLAWCMYLAYEKSSVEIKDVVILALILVLLEPCKIVYLPLTGLCLLIPKKKFQSEKHYWVSLLTVVAVMAAAVFMMNFVVVAAWAKDTQNYLSWSQTPGFTLADVLHDPYHIFQVYWETLVVKADYYQATMLGAYLGNLDPELSIPYFCIFLLWGVLFVCSLRQAGERVMFTGGQKVWTVVLIVLSCCLVLFSMLLGWTPKDFTYITGIQGRYFIPILPAALFLLYGNNLTLGKDYTRGALFLECLISIYGLIRILSLRCFV